VSSDPAALRAADTLIDFTRPEATLEYLRTGATSGVNMVIGTTGFGEPASRQSVPRPRRSRSSLRRT
jgi:4-hydroxy-tetrahydrodipicolinate reductase